MQRFNAKKMLELKVAAAKQHGGVNLHIFTEEEMQAHNDKLIRDAVTEAAILSMGIPLLAVKKAGWDRDDIMALADAIADEYGEYANGSKTIEEYKRYVYKETGMRFERD